MEVSDQDRRYILARAEQHLTRGLLPVDKQNILFFIKLASVIAIVTLAIFVMGVYVGAHHLL